MTKQEYYDLLVKSAFDGTFPGYDYESDTCLYRTPDGKHKCAVGVLIPDEKYSQNMDDGLPLRQIMDILGSEILPQGITASQLADIRRRHDDMVRKGWDAKAFIRLIDEYYYFRDITKVTPEEVVSS